MTTPLAGRRVLVTGASSGIGAATARALASEGASVALVARRSDRLDALCDGITSAGGRAVSFAADLVDPDRARSIVDDAAVRLGGLDIVVNNAGMLTTGTVEEALVSEFDRMIAVNLNAFLYVAHAAVPHLLESARSSEHRVSDLVNVSSASGRRAVAGSAVYNLTKWGVTGFSDSLRQELATRDVRVGLVEPGGVETELPQSIRPEIAAAAPSGFSGYQKLDADDIADTIRFMVTRGRNVAVNELLVRPTHQVV